MPALHKLSEKEYQQTFEPPMHLLGLEEESSKVNLRAYVEGIIQAESLPTTRKDIEIHYVYHHPRKLYEHILLHYGLENLYLVMVIDLIKKAILGYHLLDLQQQYQ